MVLCLISHKLGLGMEPINLLFADEDADIQQIVEFALRDENINVIFAENGSQALMLWRTRNVQVMILDIMMPLMDGLEVCKRVRQVSDAPIIMLTAKDQEQDILNAFDAGADDYIVKPFAPKELVSRIRMLLYRNMRQRVSPKKQLAFDSLILTARNSAGLFGLAVWADTSSARPKAAVMTHRSAARKASSRSRRLRFCMTDLLCAAP